MLTSEILKGAKAVILEKGWHQGSFSKVYDGEYVPKNGTCFCMWGALDYASGSIMFGQLEGNNEVAFSILNDVIGYSVATFNDDPETTIEDVLHIFDRAIAIAEERESNAS